MYNKLAQWLTNNINGVQKMQAKYAWTNQEQKISMRLLAALLPISDGYDYMKQTKVQHNKNLSSYYNHVATTNYYL